MADILTMLWRDLLGLCTEVDTPLILTSGGASTWPAGGYDAPEPVTGRKGSFAAAAAFVLPPPEDELAEVATSHLYQVHPCLPDGNG